MHLWFDREQIATKAQPILVGTTSVEKSEMLGQLLNEYDLMAMFLLKNYFSEWEIKKQSNEPNDSGVTAEFIVQVPKYYYDSIKQF